MRNRETIPVTRFAITLMVCLLVSRCAAASPEIQVLRAPNDGLQPQAAIDSSGTLHLIYFKGEPGGGDLFYVRQDRGKSDFSQPIRVNSIPNSAVAIGSIRGAQLALGRSNRLHVAWNPSQKSGAKGMQYSRLNDAA